jgi:myb proto-oncogene protein
MTGSAGNFSDVPVSCLGQQVGNMVVDGFHGLLEPNNKMGLESDFALPPLESGSIEEIHGSAPIDVKSLNNHHFNDTPSCFNHNDHFQSSNVEDLFGFGNHGQGENLRMGEWDFDGLIQDIPYFSSLDFQV